ncbi:MAG: LacI family transcriptional regulator [Chloroflexi bacterium]|nr:LacI family transcriptional regulator [Chloroflexota bacterium]
MTTIRDIARRAKVSVGTVSNYLNSPDIVSEKSQRAIRKAIDELAFHPKAAARSLKSNQTRRIGLVPVISPEENRSQEPSDIAFLEFLSAVNTAAAENNYSLLLRAATSAEEELSNLRQLVGEKHVDGVIILGTRPVDRRIEFLLEAEFAFVSFGRSAEMKEHPYVDVDGAKGIAEAVHYLAGLGHRRIGYITPPDDLMCSRDRSSGFLSAMEEHDLQVDDALMVSGDFSVGVGQAATNRMLNLPEPPTAILAANDMCAFGAMRAVHTCGLIPGQDVSVIGFDDIHLAAHWQPALTTVAQPLRRIGFTAAQMLIDGLSGRDVQKQLILEPHLVIRQSTGIVRGHDTE